MGRTTPPRRASHAYVDTVSRLVEDSKGEIEYVRGLGAVRVDRDDTRSEEYLPKTSTGKKSATPPGEEEYFLALSVATREVFAERVEIKWTPAADALSFSHRGHEIEGVGSIIIKEIRNVSYRVDNTHNHLHLDGTSSSKDTSLSFDEILFIMCDDQNLGALRSVIERRIGGMKVNGVEPNFFAERADSLRRFRDSRKSLPPKQLLRNKSLPQSYHHRGVHQKSSARAFHQLHEGRSDRPQVAKTNKNLDDQVESEHRDSSPVEDAAEDDEMNKVMIGQPARVNPTNKLLYRSGEIVSVGDLVVRLRDPESMTGGKHKSHMRDVFDGPWVVAELPRIFAVPVSSLFEEDDQTSADRLDAKEKAQREIQDKLIRLRFPKKSKAEPWTSLRRLRPVYQAASDTLSVGTRNAFLDRRLAHKKIVINVRSVSEAHSAESGIVVNTNASAHISRLPRTKTHSNEVTEPRTVAGVVRIVSGVYAAVQHVSSEPRKAGQFEVETLRGKCLWRCFSKDVKNSQIHKADPMIKRYLDHEGGYVNHDECLVVMYLVHWAGWPSEDDTWVDGSNNIPQHLMEEYDQMSEPFDGSRRFVSSVIVNQTRTRRHRHVATPIKRSNRKRRLASSDLTSDDSDEASDGSATSTRRARRLSATSRRRDSISEATARGASDWDDE